VYEEFYCTSSLLATQEQKLDLKLAGIL